MSNLLSGNNNNSNINSLLGIGNKLKKKTPLIVSKLKTDILDNLIIPMIKDNWQHINNNYFLISLFKNKAESYYFKYKVEELLMYNDLLTMIEIALNEHNQLFDLEKEKYSNKKDSTSIIYKTKMIRLKAEYEIYNIIYGKPKKNDTYDNNKLQEIQNLLKLDGITFDKIKKRLLEI